ncbi:HlyC/CorC family transporter [bacterium]|nr:MAG: HlyC/CorC family transporter [bacterium]
MKIPGLLMVKVMLMYLYLLFQTPLRVFTCLFLKKRLFTQTYLLTGDSGLLYQVEYYFQKRGSSMLRFFRRKKIDSEARLKELIAQSEDEGIITQEEEELIASIFEIGDTPVEEVMAPRVDLVAVPANTRIEDIVKLYRENAHGKIPVYIENIDNIVGIIYTKELLKLWGCQEKLYAVDVMKLPYFIPYTKNVLETLREFQKLHISVAIVVDEYGGVEGLVTTEDLVEEIVGELQDELDRDRIPVKRLKDGSLVVRGITEIEEIEEKLGVNIGEEDVRTIGGLILKKLGRVPRSGERIEISGLQILILEASRQRIHRLIVRKL